MIDPLINCILCTVIVDVISKKQALESAEKINKNSVDGVFLVSHYIDHQALHEIYILIRESYPEMWIGINYHEMVPKEIFRLKLLPACLDGLWINNQPERSTVDGNLQSDIDFWEEFNGYRKSRDKNILFFKETSFGGQKNFVDLEKVISVQSNMTDVICTSGSKEGRAPNLDRVKEMRSYLPPWTASAVTSGITPENIMSYRAFADWLFVKGFVTNQEERIELYRLEALLSVFE